MTHYAIVVFDSEFNVENLLAPYDENLDVDWYHREDVQPSDIDLFMKNMHIHYPDDSHLSLQDMYNKYGEKWNGGSVEWRFTYDKDGNQVVQEWTTYNPNSKYDYYSVVGYELPDYVPYAFVTPDGKWHSKGRVGWWGASFDEMTDRKWKSIYKDAVEKYKNSDITLLDLHI
jgi:hypothetical protein